jgi:hypothetical protein
MLGRKADLRTPRDLSRYIRREVVDSARVQYAEECVTRLRLMLRPFKVMPVIYDDFYIYLYCPFAA